MTQPDPTFVQGFLNSLERERPGVTSRLTSSPNEDSLPQLRGEMNIGFERLHGEMRTGFTEARLYTSEELRREVGPVREEVRYIRGKVDNLYWAIGTGVAVLAVCIAVATLVITLVK